MATCNPFPEGKIVFLVIYAAVVASIVFSTLVIVSFYTSPAASAGGGGNGKPLHLVATSLFSSSSPPPSPIVTRTPKLQREPSDMFTRAIWDVPVDSKMPDLKSFQLTKEMVKQHAKDNIIIVTFGNHAFLDFILNWVKHLTDLNIFNILVGAMDTKLLEALYWKGIPVFDMGSEMITVDIGWGSTKFRKMGREKVLLINALLPFGYEFLMCDADMVWLKNPLPYFARFPEADLLTSTDQLRPTTTDDSLEVWQKVITAYNIGMFHWRPTDSAKRLAKEWKDILFGDDEKWDQAGFNDLVHQVLGPSLKGESGLFYGYDGTLKLGLLPASIFCNGHTYFIQAMPQQLKLEPYAVHTTFQFSGSDGKRHRLREAMLFYDQPAYYDTPGGFLSFKPGIPKSLLLDGPHTVQSHFSLVNYQLKQIRTALAVASLLNRTLVMPRLWCRFERTWFAHPGILEGTLTKQPFVCPMDHLFEIRTMLHGLSEEEFGPQIHFREYSFLQNPSVPKHVKESLLNVQLCDAHSKGCNISNETTSRGFIQFPRNSTEQMYMQVFSQHKDIKVLHFSSMANAFQGFSDEGLSYVFSEVGLESSRKVGHDPSRDRKAAALSHVSRPSMPSLPLHRNNHMASASHLLFGLLLRGVRDRAALTPYSLFRSSPAALRRTSFLLPPNPIRLFRATVQPRSGSRLQSEMEAVNYTFGPYKIHCTEVFHSTLHSFAMVNLRPLVPGMPSVGSHSLSYYFGLLLLMKY
ncbi:Nucleotide-diphospho-sugar transferase [Musa troglodytarum]|uniref:Nucleotide-diphospho-sugar transferase n=1 Tax=Musa troglodytarum TaxID=320322 RepID=A0A9E7EKP1_9LILI|nr:Nucleotide-diphospho-sugar transferase [Musa troglodytarum]